MKFVCALFAFVSAATYTVGDPVQVSIAPQPTGGGINFVGATGCQDAGITTASCSVSYSAFNGAIETGGTVQATASFGSLSGAGQGGGNTTPGTTTYNTSFSDYVLVTGGTGTGTLVANYQLSAGAAQSLDPMRYGNEEVGSPEFSFVAGSKHENVYTYLPDAYPLFSEAFSISSPFQFGTPLAFGADTQAIVYYFATGGNSANGSASSSVQLTSFTVLDANGNVIGSAQVSPEHVAGLDFFTPEPASAWLALAGIALLWPMAGRRRKSQSRELGS